MRKLVLPLAVFGCLAVAPAWSQGTPEQIAACKDDAYKFCPWDVPDPQATEKCMRTYMKSLSPACRSQFGDAGARSKRAGR